MGKGDTKASARKNRAKAAKADPFKLTPIKHRERNGQKSRSAHPPEDPRATVFQARCRQAGKKPTEEAMKDAASVDHEHPALRCITLGAGIGMNAHRREAEITRLRDGFDAFDKAQERFYTIVLGIKRFANVAKIEFMPEVFETRADHTPDPRSHEERIAAAKKAYRYWIKRYEGLGSHERVLIDQGLQRYDGYVRDGRVTTSGQAFIAALRVMLAEK